MYEFTDSTKRITQLEQSWTAVEKGLFDNQINFIGTLFPPRCKRAFLLLDTGQDDKSSANSLSLKTLVVQCWGFLFALLS